MKYKEALKLAMEKLAKEKNAIFLGQQVGVEDFYKTLTDIPESKRLEMPVAEELQLGMSIGLALEGFLPISIYQRMDFLPRAFDQLVNHLNLIKEMSEGKFNPKILIRTTIGSKEPLDTGPQHSKDLYMGVKLLLPNINVIKVKTAKEVIKAYDDFLKDDRSWMIVEDQNLYGS